MDEDSPFLANSSRNGATILRNSNSNLNINSQHSNGTLLGDAQPRNHLRYRRTSFTPPYSTAMTLASTKEPPKITSTNPIHISHTLSYEHRHCHFLFMTNHYTRAPPNCRLACNSLVPTPCPYELLRVGEGRKKMTRAILLDCISSSLPYWFCQESVLLKMIIRVCFAGCRYSQLHRHVSVSKTLRSKTWAHLALLTVPPFVAVPSVPSVPSVPLFPPTNYEQPCMTVKKNADSWCHYFAHIFELGSA